MPISCSKCGFLNPYGAEICGECGQTLAVDIEPVVHEDKSPPPLAVTMANERLPEIPIIVKAKKGKAPVPVQILSGVLLTSGALLVTISIIFFLTDNLSFLAIPYISAYTSYHFLLPFLFCIVGIYTIIVGYGISNLKKWGITIYISWVLIQVMLMILARVYHGRLGLTYSPVVLGELIIIALLWRIKHRFLY